MFDYRLYYKLILLLVAGMMPFDTQCAGLLPTPMFPGDSEITGVFLDVDGSPVTGVTVVTEYEMSGPRYHGSWHECYYINVTKSDRDGRFVLPSWSLPPKQNNRTGNTRKIVAFKAGFSLPPAVSDNNNARRFTVALDELSLIRLREDLGEIKLQRWQRNTSEYLEYLAELSDGFEYCKNSDNTLSALFRQLYMESRVHAASEKDFAYVYDFGRVVAEIIQKKTGKRLLSRGGSEFLERWRIDMVLDGRVQALIKYLALKEAVKNNDLKDVIQLLEGDVDIDLDDGDRYVHPHYERREGVNSLEYRSLLDYAIWNKLRNKSTGIAEKLIAAGITIPASKEIRYLSAAINMGRVPLARALLQRGVNTDVSGNHELERAVIHAVTTNDIAMLKLLFDYPFDIGAIASAMSKDAVFPWPNNEMFEYLLDRGVTPDLKNYLDNPFYLSAMLIGKPGRNVKRLQLAKLFLSHGAKVGIYPYRRWSGIRGLEQVNPLSAAVRTGDEELILMVIKASPVLLQGRPDVVTMLEQKYPGITTPVYDFDAAIKPLNAYYRLKVAVEDDDIEEVNQLIDEGVKLDLKDDQYTPLVIAVLNNNLKIASVLLQHGANPNPNPNPEAKNSPLILATCSGSVLLTKLLLVNGAMANWKSLAGAIDGGVASHAVEMEAMAQRSKAFSTGKSKPMRLLVSPLSESVDAGHHGDDDIREQQTSSAVSQRSSVKISDPVGPVVKHRSDEEKSRRLTLVKMLLDNGAEINAMDDYIDATVLMLAAYGGYTDVLKELLDSGADVTIKNSAGLTALDIARQRGFMDVVDLLQ